MRRVAGILLVVYLAVLAAIALWPTPVDRPYALVLDQLIGRLHAAGLTWITYHRIESTANAILFLPFGLLLAGLLGRGWRWLALSVCVAATFSIEFIQGELLPQRTADVRDIVANSVGAAIGIGLVVLAELVRGRRRKGRTPGPTPARPDPPA